MYIEMYIKLLKEDSTVNKFVWWISSDEKSRDGGHVFE